LKHSCRLVGTNKNENLFSGEMQHDAKQSAVLYVENGGYYPSVSLTLVARSLKENGL
jgi:hypothetical protein